MTKITIQPNTARQLAIKAQFLDWTVDNASSAAKSDILTLLKQIRCLQLDPINVVARNPLLIIWSRLGQYETKDLTDLIYKDRELFEYWAHAASIVLAEDFPIHHKMMESYRNQTSQWSIKIRKWVEANCEFKNSILSQLSDNGPMYANQFNDNSRLKWESDGWGSGKNISIMLDYLWLNGEITVANRDGAGFGLKKQWVLTNKHLPQWAEYQPVEAQTLISDAVEKSIKALGLGTEKHIKNHFVRNRYTGLSEILTTLVKSKILIPVAIPEINSETWYIHTDNLPMLDQLEKGDFSGSTRLLSPFDNLICDRERTEALFNFYYRTEIYTPKSKRQFGYYVMPILHGDKLIGRIDPKYDRKKKELIVNAIYFEPDALKLDKGVVEKTIESLATFLEAEDVRYAAK